MDVGIYFYAVSIGIVCLTAVSVLVQSEVTQNQTPQDDTGIPVQFPASSKATFLQTRENNSSGIPVSIFLNKEIKSLDDFMLNFVTDKASSGVLSRNKNGTSLLRSSNTDRDGSEHSLSIPSAMPLISDKIEDQAPSSGLFVDTVFNEFAPLAACMPEPTTIKLEEPTDPAYIYFPPCTKIDKCGGCCTHPRLSCQPTQVEDVNVKMLMMRFDPESDNFVPEGIKTVVIEKHNSCECRCSVKEEHCTARQHYLPNECRCKCNNEEEMDLCTQPSKYWNPLMCECACRQVQECSTGFYYDPEVCICKRDRIPNLVFRARNDNFPRFKGESYEIIETRTSNLPPKPAFRGRRDVNNINKVET